MSPLAKPVSPVSPVPPVAAVPSPPADPTGPLFDVAVALSRDMRAMFGRPSVPWREWTEFVQDRAARDWIGEARTAADRIEALAKGRGAVRPVRDAVDDVIDSVNRLRRFMPQWSVRGPLADDDNTPVTVTAGSVARFTALRFEARGRFVRLRKLVVSTTGEAADDRLSDKEMDTLAFLAGSSGPCKAAAIENHFGFSTSVVKKMMPPLVARGLVVRPARGPGYHITDAGRRAILPNL